MKILTASAIKEWDTFTITHEPISSIDLMERAAVKSVDWILQHFEPSTHCNIFCGKGNNGGDGLAIARLLLEHQFSVTVYILEFGKMGSQDFQRNLHRLHHYPSIDIHFLQEVSHFPGIDKNDLVIDALFGYGLNKPLAGLSLALAKHINTSKAKIIAIDMPSGLFADHSSFGCATINATFTLSFQCYKLAFLFAENAAAFGQIHILDIGLLPEYLKNLSEEYSFIDAQMIASIYQPRKAFTHKGSFGHAFLICGSYGKMGAAMLATKACLRSGAGLVTVQVPASGYEILQTTVPEAMIVVDSNSTFITDLAEDFSLFAAIGMGPGMGKAEETGKVLSAILSNVQQPVVLDADALNLISQDKRLLNAIPEGSIITPHPKEFERLFGKSENEFARMEKARQKAIELKLIIVLKGHHTIIATTGGKLFFNSTGNAGMATAGNGDVLTGIITGLLAQGYASEKAAVLGVYLHGLAGDLAAAAMSMESLIASDIIETLGAAYLQLK